jgi:hypothetical protein
MLLYLTTRMRIAGEMILTTRKRIAVVTFPPIDQPFIAAASPTDLATIPQEQTPQNRFYNPAQITHRSPGSSLNPAAAPYRSAVVPPSACTGPWRLHGPAYGPALLDALLAMESHDSSFALWMAGPFANGL